MANIGQDDRLQAFGKTDDHAPDTTDVCDAVYFLEEVVCRNRYHVCGDSYLEHTEEPPPTLTLICLGPDEKSKW